MDLGTGALLMSGGGSLLDALFGGSNMSPLEKEQLRMLQQRRGFSSQLWGQLQGKMGNPGQFMGQYQKAMNPLMNQFAGQASQRAGLDSGAGQGALAKYGMGLMNQGYMGQQSELMRLLAGLAG